MSQYSQDFAAFRGLIEIRMDAKDQRDIAEPMDILDYEDELHVSERAARRLASGIVQIV